jgi:hypothetical protein
MYGRDSSLSYPSSEGKKLQAITLIILKEKTKKLSVTFLNI